MQITKYVFDVLERVSFTTDGYLYGAETEWFFRQFTKCKLNTSFRPMSLLKKKHPKVVFRSCTVMRLCSVNGMKRLH